jgi:geranylgeranyl reductase family protein
VLLPLATHSGMKMQQPIAIVGGGPAGSLAGSILAQGGRRVLLFEEKLAWEKPCGGGLTHKALKQYPFLAETQTEHNILQRCELISPSGKSVQFDLRYPMAIFSRCALNGLLLERARLSGVEIRKERVRRIRRSGEEWWLSTAEGEYRASYLVLAAGARSVFRSQLGRPFAADDLMATAGYFIPGRSSLIQIQFLKGIAGYIWTFPRAEHFSAGICWRHDGTSTSEMRRMLEAWLRKNGFDLRRAQFYSHILPALREPSLDELEVSGDGWMTIGDAAGLVDPITGEGLYYALRSGEFCAEALLAERPEEYKFRLEEEILSELKLAAGASQRFYTGQALGESVLELMVNLISESQTFRELMCELLAGIQGYRGLRARLYRSLPTMIAEGLSGALRLSWGGAEATAGGP